MSGQYEKISNEEINAVGESNSQAGLLLILANSVLADAEQKAYGEKQYVPEFHKSGWSIAIETPRGVVGLWSCWLNNQFYLGYPKENNDFPNAEQVVEQLIMQILNVEPALPVENINFGMRQWAKFYGPQLPDKKGRVWVNHSKFDSSSHHFSVITKFGNLQNVYYGHDESNGVRTIEFSFFNDKEPEAPNATPEVIQPYRDKFLALACEIAQRMGGALAVNIDYGFVLVPEQITALGYGNVKWIKGSPGTREGWGKEVVYADKDIEMLVLKSGNDLVPWSTIRRILCTSKLNAEQLISYLTF